MNVMENYLTIGTSSGVMSVFTAAPESRKCPVVIVIQEIFGVNSHIKDVCRRLAAEGFLAMAPEIFHRSGNHITADYTEKEDIMPIFRLLSNENLISDLSAVINFLPELACADTDKVFTMGFCVGGFASVLAATELSIQGAVSFYGAGVVRRREGLKISSYLEKLHQTKCPVLLFYGEKDVSIPESDRFEILRVLDENQIPHEVVVFEHADHGFFCDERRTYHQESASVAWKKTLQWMRSL
jgi:carboxymethylenebutenolidase